MNRLHSLVFVLASSFATQAAISGDVGSPATAVEPSEWINAKPGFAWKKLKGRVVIVEKWATGARLVFRSKLLSW
jgi:hypothetical protein